MIGSKGELARMAAVLAIGVLALAPVASSAQEGAAAELIGGGPNLEWRPLVDHAGASLTVTGPNGFAVRREPAAGQNPTLSLFDAKGQALADGEYSWQLHLAPRLDPQTRRQLAAARRSGDEQAVAALRDAGKLPEGASMSGTFRVAGGMFVIPEDAPERPEGPRNAAANGVRNVTAEDQVIPDDLIVQGSECVGLDCVNNWNFGFDTLVMRENNLRIFFDDTSSQAGFPANDWRIIANDSASGGNSKFSIEDSTGSRTPFTIRAGASTNSIFVDSTGRVGFRTSTPVLDLHVSTSNTPAIRMEQTNAGGFTAQTWDIAGNEANWFVRDVTGGSLLPLRIRPGAPTSSLDISADGDVGIGTASPGEQLTVRNSTANSDAFAVRRSQADANQLFRVFETTGGAGLFSIFDENGSEVARFTGVSGGRFAVGCNAPEHDIDLGNNAGAACNASPSRSFIDAGSTTFTASSSRTIKTNISPVEVPDILQRIASVGVYNYDFVEGPSDKMGLMAEDFHTVFGRGSDKLLNGQEVEMALWLAVQQLAQRNEQLTSTNEQLLDRLERLEALVAAQQAAQQ